MELSYLLRVAERNQALAAIVIRRPVEFVRVPKLPVFLIGEKDLQKVLTYECHMLRIHIRRVRKRNKSVEKQTFSKVMRGHKREFLTILGYDGDHEP